MNEIISKVFIADIDPSDKRTPVAIYPTKSEQRGNRPDLKPIPVVVAPLFFEEYLVQQPSGEWKCVGVVPLEKADRPLGWPGKIERTVTENFEVMRGWKQHVIKASPKKPLRVRTTIAGVNLK